MSDLDLSQRKELPDALRILLEEYPRGTWENHGNFGEMVRFWLERHLMFRKLLGQMQQDTRDYLDNRIAGPDYAPRLSRYGGFFLNQLHAHHNIEDTHYFPQLVKLDARIERGFDLLDSDHQAMDGLLNAFATQANVVLNGDASAVGPFLEQLNSFERLLNRHLTDEEELIVPVILHTGFDG